MSEPIDMIGLPRDNVGPNATLYITLAWWPDEIWAESMG